MKRFLLYLSMAVCMFTSTAQADYTINLFPVCEANGDQELPDIDGDWIIWADERGGSTYPHIYGYTLAEPNEVPICTDTGILKKLPAVSGNTVVWEDRRNSQRDIYAFDLLTRAPLDFTGTQMPLNDGLYQQNPDISGNYVVYQHRPGSYYNIYVYDISSDTMQAVWAASTNQYNPMIDGTLVAWMEQVDGIYQIFARDISTENPAVQISFGSVGSQFPTVSGSMVVWEEPGSGTATMTAYDLSVPGVIWTRTVSAVNAYPSISGDIIVWQELRSGGSDYNIRGYEISTETYLDISTGIKDDQRPVISGNTVVWQRSNTDLDIHAAQLLVPSTVTVTSPNGGEAYLAASSMMMTWDSEGPVDNVLIEFSSDGGANWTVVDTVPNTGSFLWDPIADVQSQQCLIAVTNADDPTATDESDAVFELYRIPDSVTVVSPNGGEMVLAGSEMDIAWTTVGEIANVSIEFADDSGQTWQTVTASTPNDGAFTWAAVPDVDSQVCSIRIRDAADVTTGDVSDTAFTVFQCDAALTADLTGDCFVDIADFAEMAAQWLECGNLRDRTWCLLN